MRTGVRFAALAVMALAILGVCLLDGSAQEKAKYTIKEVMQKAHKGGILKTVLSGKSDKAQRETLVEMYTALNQNKPPKGDEKAWKERTEGMVTAAKAVAKDDNKDATSKLQKAVNCMECHSTHRGK